MATTTWTQTAGMVSDEDVDNLESYAEQALASKNAAADSETAAAASETAAATSATNASVSASSAATSASNAATSATSASTSETNASTSATSASTSATAAASSATAAAASETAAAASETAAAASETAAGTSATNAATSETNAATSATSAATSATNAATSATAAAASETSVATNATAAATSATNAATSETNAATSETNAATSETNAATSATSAATSATSAATSASSAASAQTAAESARDATLTAYDNFDDRYLGAKTSDPSVDNDGNALVAGALYFDSTAGAMKVYTGSAWVAAYVSGTSYLPLVGGTLTGTLNFNDNVKAQFGASADLQVYHTGSASFIDDQGTGSLNIRGNNLNLQNAAGEAYISCVSDSHVYLFHDNSWKLRTDSTGINVTGTVVADGAQIDLSGTRQLNAQIATSGSGYGAITCVEPSASNLRGLELEGQLLNFGTNLYNQTTSVRRMQINETGDISFYEDTGTTAKFFWDASTERLGIGTTSPTELLHLREDNADASILLRSHSSTAGSYYATKLQFELGAASSGTRDWDIVADDPSNNGGYLGVEYEGSEKFRIAASGNVGIGTSSPSEKLDVNGTAKATTFEVNGWTITESGGSLYFATGGTNKMKLDASGNLQVVGSVDANATIT